MKKNILFVIISIITIIFLLSTAALCNFCGLGSTGSGEEKIDVESNDTAQENTATSAKEDNNGNNTQESQQDSSGKPTITLKIHEGPLYSAEDDVCYWRIEAIVTGSPVPEEVTWSKNDTSSYGPFIAQVNLTRQDPTYTLKATVKNSKGEANDSIDLKWECGGDVNIVQGDGGQHQEDGHGDFENAEPFFLPVFLVANESGCVSTDKTDVKTDTIIVGHTANDKNYRGYLSFDISGILFKEYIKSAELMVGATDIFQAPELGQLRIGKIDYGEGNLSTNVISIHPTLITGFSDADQQVKIKIDVTDLLKMYLNHNKSRLQFALWWQNENAFDGDELAVDIIIKYMMYSSNYIGTLIIIYYHDDVLELLEGL
jgi:hypothetical protein